MPAYGELQTARIEASPQTCFDALTDFESLPRWQRAVREARVLERDQEGRGVVVEYAVDARVRTVRYRLRQIYDEPRRLASEYLGGDFREFCGEWRLVALDHGATRAELDLRIDPGRFVPGFVRRAIADAVIGRALADLKSYVEAPSRPLPV
jgi:ribosome-associated toxin RatA of RatAB toxin-antitoxin module